jgi:hypothetical protein
LTIWYSVTCSRTGGVSKTCTRSATSPPRPARSCPHPAHWPGETTVTWSGSARQASECPSWPGWPPRRRGERFLAFLARLARAAGPSDPGGIEEFDESIPTRRFSCSISASSAAITASRPARAASNSSRLSSPESGTHPNYGSRRIPAITTETGASTSSPTPATPEWIPAGLNRGLPPRSQARPGAAPSTRSAQSGAAPRRGAKNTLG